MFISIDPSGEFPSGTTGICVVGFFKLTTLTIKAKDYSDAHSYFKSIIDFVPKTGVVNNIIIENYLPWGGGTLSHMTKELIGVLKFEFHKIRKDIVIIQNPSCKQSFKNKANIISTLSDIGIKHNLSKVSIHELDAVRHFLYYYLKTNV